MRLRCQDIGTSCPHVANGETEREVINVMVEHLRVKHAFECKFIFGELTEGNITAKLRRRIQPSA